MRFLHTYHQEHQKQIPKIFLEIIGKMIHTLPEILTVIEKFGTDFPEEDEFSNQMRVAARSHVKADLANEVDSTIKGYKNTILDDLADDKFDGANGVLTLFRNHLTNRKATDIPP